MLPKLHSRCQGSGNKTQLDSFVVTTASTILFLCLNSSVLYSPLIQETASRTSPFKKKNVFFFEFAQYMPSLINPSVKKLGLCQAG